MVACPSASACGRATAVRGSQRPGRLRRVWRGAGTGGVGGWRRARPLVGAPSADGWHQGWVESPESPVPGPCARPSKPGDSRHPPCPWEGSNRGARQQQPPAAGMDKASRATSRSHTALAGSPRRSCGWSSCMRGHERRSQLRPLPPPKPGQARPGPPTCGRGTPRGSPAGPRPRPPAPRMRAGGRDAGGVGHARGGSPRSALAAWPRPATPAAPVADGQRRPTHPRSRRAIAWGLQSRGGVSQRQPRGGRYAPRRGPRRKARIPRFSRPSKTKPPPWNLVCGGSRTLRPSLPGGS